MANVTKVVFFLKFFYTTVEYLLSLSLFENIH